MSARPLLAIAALAAAVAACAPVPPAGGMIPPPSTAFRIEDFGWSTLAGRNTIEGSVTYQSGGRRYSCTGSIGLTPDTPYTRNRFLTLYGNNELAAVPEATVRARTVADPNADYRSFVRSETCANNTFRFGDLPDGSWYVIAPVSAGGERIVLMRRVVTRGGRPVPLVM